MISYKNRIYIDTATGKFIEQTIQGSKPFHIWLLRLERNTLRKAFIYSGYTESSYLCMAWDDYSHNKTEFVAQWSLVLDNYYQYLMK